MMMQLDPEIAALFAGFPAPDPTVPRPSAQEARELHRAIAQSMTSFLQPIHSITDLAIPGPAGEIKLRLYRPSAGVENLPLLIFMHGGGWIGGDLDTHEMLCRDIALGAACAVIAIDYRLAPEHRFPAAVDDCLAATAYVLDHAIELGVDPARIAIGGDSAGGNLAAVTVQALKDRSGPRPCRQLLIYPATDFRRLTASFTECAEAPGLTTRDIIWCTEQYLGSEADGLDPRAAPILATSLAGTPPTFVATAELDPLRDDGEAYAVRLVAAGTDVRMRRYLGMPHSFLSLPPSITRRQLALAEICDFLSNRSTST